MQSHFSSCHFWIPFARGFPPTNDLPKIFFFEKQLAGVILTCKPFADRMLLRIHRTKLQAKAKVHHVRTMHHCVLPKQTAPLPLKRLVSKDGSRNFIVPFGNGQLESRLVLRRSTNAALAAAAAAAPTKDSDAAYRDKLCVYVSSQAGCNMGCGECHLTATQQTSMRPATPRDYSHQVHRVMDEWKNILSFSTDQTKLRVKQVNIEFMARGEPLMNPYVRNKWYHSFLFFQFTNVNKYVQYCCRPDVVASIAEPLSILKPDIVVKYNISTIMPKMFSAFTLFPFLIP